MSKRSKQRRRPLTEADLSPNDRREVEQFKDFLRRGATGIPQEKAYILTYSEIGAPLEPTGDE